MSGLFGIGVSGLAAAQAGLVTTGHNIANSGTPGFHRQQVVQSNATPLFQGSGFIGQGVNVDTVRRVYDSFLDGQANRADAQASYYTAFNAQVGQIDSLLSDPSAGLAPQLQSFFASVNDVATNPASIPSRQAMISSANSLASRFQALDNRLVEINGGVNSQIESTVSGVNAYAREIASINARISSTGASPTQAPNDLLDRRDQLVSELNKLTGASTVTQADGTVSVSIGSGQALVVGSQYYGLGTAQSAEVPGQLDVTYKTGGAAAVLGQSTLTAGSLGALLSFRSTTLVDTQNQLGRIAAGLAESFNVQHAHGQDLVGGLGTNFFVPPTAAVTAHAANTGTGSVSVGISIATDLTASNYRVVYRGPGSYDVTRLSDNTTTNYPSLPPPMPAPPAPQTQAIDGLTITASGPLAVGDSFLVEPTRSAARNLTVAISDPTRIAAATPSTSASLTNTGTGTIGAVTLPNGTLLQRPVTLTFAVSGAVPPVTTFSTKGVLDAAGNPADVNGVAYTPGGNISYNGWTVQVAGAPRSGDTFQVSPTGPSDSSNALALANLQVKSTLNGGTASYQAAYGQLTSSVGNTAAEMDIDAKAQDTIALRSRESQQALSGVNLDEEAANLMRYQQAYQASSKVIQVAQTMFETILQLGH